MSELSGSEVSWLTEIQRSTGDGPGPAPTLSTLLVNADGSPIRTLEAWEARREEIRQRWLSLLRPVSDLPAVAPPLEVVTEQLVGDVTRQLVRYQVGPRAFTEAHLLKPVPCRARAPGVVVFHSTVDESIDEPAGISGPAPKALGWEFARRGFVALCPRNFLWRNNHSLTMRWQTFKFLCRHPNSTGMAKMLHDAMVAVSVLARLPEVDSSRLGTVGHSLGAKQALYLAAFDERIRVAASNEGGIGIPFSNWDAPWYLGRQVRRKGFHHEHHEVLSLVAPRSFLLLGGDGYDGEQSRPFIDAVLPVYDLYGSPARVGLYNHRQGHCFPQEAAERIYEWVEAYC